MLKQDHKVEILGTEYDIHFVSTYPDYLEEAGDGAGGLFSWSNKEIYILTTREKDVTSSGLERDLAKTLRHEIIHAYLSESGLLSDTNSCCMPWAENEEMVDWFAIQSPKIYKTFLDLGIL